MLFRLTEILGEVRHLKQFKEKLIDIESRKGERFQIWLKCNYSLYSYSIYSIIGNKQKEVDYSYKNYKKIKDLIDDLRLSLLKLGFLDIKEKSEEQIQKNTKKKELIQIVNSFSEDEFPEFCTTLEESISLPSNENGTLSIGEIPKQDREKIFKSMSQNKNNFIELSAINKNKEVLCESYILSKAEEDFTIKGRTPIGKSLQSLRSNIFNLNKKVEENISNGSVEGYIFKETKFEFKSDLFSTTAFVTVTNRDRTILEKLIEVSSDFRKGNLKEIKHFVFFRQGNLSSLDSNFLNSIGNKYNIYFQELPPLKTSEREFINSFFGSNNRSNVGAERRDALNSLEKNYSRIIMFDDNITNILYVPSYNIQKGYLGRNVKDIESGRSILLNRNLFLKFIGEILYKDYDLFTISSLGQFLNASTGIISKISTGFMSFKRDLSINFEPFSLSEDRDFGLKYLKAGKQVVISDIYMFKKLGNSKDTGVGNKVYENEEYLNYLKNRFLQEYKNFNLKASIRPNKETGNKSVSLNSDILEKGIVYQK